MEEDCNKNCLGNPGAPLIAPLVLMFASGSETQYAHPKLEMRERRAKEFAPALQHSRRTFHTPDRDPLQPRDLIYLIPDFCSQSIVRTNVQFLQRCWKPLHDVQERNQGKALRARVVRPGERLERCAEGYRLQGLLSDIAPSRHHPEVQGTLTNNGVRHARGPE